MEPPRALPLLSGIAPRLEANLLEPNCRRCHKDFNLFTRKKFCNHCGYNYCSSCCDHQALCPRSDSRSHPGYENVLVCTYCIDMLSITGSGKTQLRNMPIARLRTYLDSYGIKTKSALEKEDLIEAIMTARGENGCLSHAQEEYYRRVTIPKRNPVESRFRNMFAGPSTSGPPPTPPRPRSTDPRLSNNPPPPPASPRPIPRQNGSNGRPSGSSSRPTSPRLERPQPQYAYNTASPQRTRHETNPGSPPPAPRYQNRPTAQENLQPPPQQTRQRSQSVPRQPPPRPAQSPPPRAPAPSTSPRPVLIPQLSELLNATPAEVASLSVASLKGILQANHVNARMILEKSELVEKVVGLIEIEKRERAREQAIHEQEEMVARERQRDRMEQIRAQEEEQPARKPNIRFEEPKKAATSSTPSPPPVSTGFVEREGLCVVCQDEEANVAIVDCGHLALCMGCSDIIMKSTKECPLCRTRIVTEQRLLRIFKT